MKWERRRRKAGGLWASQPRPLPGCLFPESPLDAPGGCRLLSPPWRLSPSGYHTLPSPDPCPGGTCAGLRETGKGGQDPERGNSTGASGRGWGRPSPEGELGARAGGGLRVAVCPCRPAPASRPRREPGTLPPKWGSRRTLTRGNLMLSLASRHVPLLEKGVKAGLLPCEVKSRNVVTRQVTVLLADQGGGGVRLGGGCAASAGPRALRRPPPPLPHCWATRASPLLGADARFCLSHSRKPLEAPEHQTCWACG